LTMFAHEIKQISVIARVYDYCLSEFERNECVSLYLSAALLLYFKKDLLHKVKNPGDALQDLHVFFQEIKWKKINFEKIIQISEELFEKYPPSVISPETVRLYAEMDEIKENTLLGDADSSSEYNSDFLSPLVDRDEDCVNFEMIDEEEEEEEKEDVDTNAKEEEEEENKKRIMENNDKYKPKEAIKERRKNKPKMDIFEPISGYFDEFVSLFGKNNKKKARKRYTATTSSDGI